MTLTVSHIIYTYTSLFIHISYIPNDLDPLSHILCTYTALYIHNAHYILLTHWAMFDTIKCPIDSNHMTLTHTKYQMTFTHWATFYILTLPYYILTLPYIFIIHTVYQMILTYWNVYTLPALHDLDLLTLVPRQARSASVTFRRPHVTRTPARRVAPVLLCRIVSLPVAVPQGVWAESVKTVSTGHIACPHQQGSQP